MRSPWHFLRTFSLALLALTLTNPSLRAEDPSAASGWRQFGEEQGITLWMREIPGAELPGFGGRATIASSADSIIAVVEDVAHHKDWMFHCSESGLLQPLEGEAHALIYNRTEAVWPVWDRDAILETRLIRSQDGRTTTIRFQNVDSTLKPVPRRVVRMPRLVGFYQIEALGPSRSRVTYQVEADPGGSLPGWLAKRVVREMPRQTLVALRARVSGS